MFMLEERANAKGLSVGLSICPSQSWSRPKRFKILKYIERGREMFLVSSTFLTSNYIVLSLGVRHKCAKEKYTPQSENVTRPNLGNGLR